MRKSRASLGLAACLFVVGSACGVKAVEVESFGFPYAHGRVETFSDAKSSQVGAATALQLKERYPQIQDVRLFCIDVSGPRLAYIDGIFYALNEKAARQGAYVTTAPGRAEVFDIEKPPSPVAGDFLMIFALTRDAGEACQTLFR
ncbi:hypothetical protein ABID21_004648 [Pseudorhizobium tarimense]|uniref:Uncharacterized protein n=1 Tax=Pseudorhizobium tarimense TaxID=1079109 RepID=A0ABV2HDP1_9HYPH|nr:hypothetical protein [Pseudorhizobium tarimense]MCJ8521517.1 hypothetical protein [Pseudorhizobium tarimense]